MAPLSLKSSSSLLPILLRLFFLNTISKLIADDLDRVKIETFLKKPFDIVDFEAALHSACAKAGRNSREGEWLPEVELEGVPVSTFVQGTLRNRT